MRTPANEALFAARVAKGWFSQESAAKGVSSAGREALRDPHYEVSVRTFRRWESANPGWPRPDQATAIRAAFGRGPETLGFQPLESVPVDIPAEPPAIIPPVKRRTALAGVAAIGLPWLNSSAPGRTGASDLRIGEEEIAVLQATAADLDAIDQRFGGDRLWRSAKMHLSYIHYVIDHGVYADEIGQELHAIAGQLTTSLGWFCYDADQQTEARVYFSEALNAAMLTGDNPLATRTLSNMSRQCIDLGKPREAVRFARTAEQYAAKWGAPPRVSALLSIRAAQGYARAGDEVNASLSIKKAWRSFDQGATDRDPEWTGFLNEAELVCLEGMARSDLGQHKRAVRLLDRSAALQDIEHSRNRGMCLARLAGAALSDRDYDRTTDAALESLRLIEGGQSSTRTRRQLAVVRDSIGGHKASPPLRETFDLLTHHIA
jgi:tetratricopeptide (TPR) repeat protein